MGATDFPPDATIFPSINATVNANSVEISKTNLSAVKYVANGVIVILVSLVIIAIVAVLLYYRCRKQNGEKRPPKGITSTAMVTSSADSNGWDDNKIAHSKANNNTKITRALKLN
jgi:hypothetical protein